MSTDRDTLIRLSNEFAFEAAGVGDPAASCVWREASERLSAAWEKSAAPHTPVAPSGDQDSFNVRILVRISRQRDGSLTYEGTVEDCEAGS